MLTLILQKLARFVIETTWFYVYQTRQLRKRRTDGIRERRERIKVQKIGTTTKKNENEKNIVTKVKCK
jgi:hypothetical protein